ncbi:MAG: VOC family protein [Pseudomonadota bacterium]|nr:VOC family protein [Pseudomonadota bacterium]
MTTMRIEHVNVTVRDAERSAALLQRIFGWQVRWSGPARDGGRAVHVGSDEHYIALYSPAAAGTTEYEFIKGRPLNHIGVEVADLEGVEARVSREGLTPFEHGDYDPGRRFYFLDPDGIEYEVVSYQVPALSKESMT